ncbi:hypothetical protein GW916_08350, partial [bacterium]|nr:hypothetical protein [bacterium]
AFGLYGTAKTAFGAISPNSAYLYNGAPAGLVLMAGTLSAPIVFATGGTAEKMRIDGQGNVGIGTATPRSQLHLESAGTASSYLTIAGNTASAGNYSSGIALMTDRDSSFIGSGTNKGWTIAGFSENYTTAGLRNDLGFSYWNGSAWTTPLTIDVGGGIGIGTSAPDTKLHVVGTSGTTLKIVDGNQAAGRVLTSDANGVASWAAPAGTGDFLKDGSVSMTGNLRLGTNWITQSGSSFGVRVDGTNSVLIGEGTTGTGGSTPTLVVQDNSAGEQASLMFIDSGNDSSAIGITSDDYFAIASEDSQSGIQFKVNGGWAADYLNTATTAMTIRSSGNVGIGTTSPGQKLHIEGGDGTNMQITRSGVDKVFLGDLGGDNDGGVIFYDSSGAAKTVIRGGANSYIQGGNVGIGTSSPTAKLDVNGKIRGTATLSYDDLTVGILTTSTSTVNMTGLSTTISVQNGDIVKVDLSCNGYNASAATLYMRIGLTAGSASVLQYPNWSMTSSTGWTALHTQGLYQASADGSLTFSGQWHVGSGTGYAQYCSIIAYVLGK